MASSPRPSVCGSYPVAFWPKTAALFQQESAPLQVGALLGCQPIQPNVAATLIGLGASAQGLLDPRGTEAESGRAAFRGGAALRLNEFHGLA